MKNVQTVSRIIIGIALVALLLIGSARPPASLSPPSNFTDPGVAALNAEGKFLYNYGSFSEARTFFHSAARAADAAGDDRAAAMNRNNAGAAELVLMQYGEALKDFTEAQRRAEKAHQLQPLLFSFNNLASLYVQIGQADNAIRVVRDALDGPAGHIDEAVRARLLKENNRGCSW